MDALLGRCALETLRQRKSFKWRAYPPDVLPAFVAEMDFDLAEPIAGAIRAALAAGDCGYGYASPLAGAFAEFAARRLGWAPDESRVFAIPDVMTGIAEVLRVVTPPGAGIVINPPVYFPFFHRLALIGRRVVEAPLIRLDDGRYDLDPAALDLALSQDGVRGYLMCSPHNPVGRVWSREQLLTAAELCQRHDAALLVDEIHAALVLPGAGQVPFLSLDHEMTERAWVFTSATKAWNIPGLKCAVAVAGSDQAASVLRELAAALLPGHHGVLGTVAAFTGGLPWLDAVLAQLDQNRARLAELLAENLPPVGYVPPEAGFLAWLDCRRLGLGDDPAVRFLDRGRVALNPGAEFGTQGRGHARLNVATSPELMAEAVRRMAAAC